MATKFYRCAHCGNVIQKVVDKRVPVVCCGQKMEELIPGTVEASVEKHLPVVTWVDDHTIKVEVGSVAHPMLEEHHIAFVYVETENGGIRINEFIYALDELAERILCEEVLYLVFVAVCEDDDRVEII